MAGALSRNNVVVSGDPDGPPMVFAHGFGCDQNMWRFVAPAFEADHHVVRFDHVGAGGADPAAWSAQRYSSLDPYAEDLLEILAELDLRDVVLVAHSVSAMIAVLAAAREPQRFAHLVLVCPSPRYVDDDGYRGGFSATDIDELLAAMDGNHLGWSGNVAPMVMGNPDRPELGDELTNSFCRTDPKMAQLFARVTFLSDTRAELAAVTTPTLILQCTDDVIAPDEVGAYVHEAIAGSTLVHLAATGHCPNLSAPEETTAAIQEYLASAPARRDVHDG